jgi:hypothetical protein
VGKICKLLLQGRRQLDHLESGRVGRVRSKDVQASGIADDADSIPSRQGLFGKQPSRIEQLTQRVHTQHAGLPEQGVDSHIGSRCCRRMRSARPATGG